MMPKVIGVLTSNTGAVIRDIINVKRLEEIQMCILDCILFLFKDLAQAEKIAEAIYVNE